ncbi:UDP-N-acetyl-D-mannosaminuronic acid dehydrogenase [Colwellia sp. MT41]|uniref:UDP-N-acetyl-D-mannosamine dehydrogenase n=1 Tax=Colwellia sp. MT41 TaxID=58049 RepID=UPI000717659F|nr:UDP-N-acetyl-D-mannosamine dehydrogenase [Colwellia sp. MT41]ALO35136.1 UDP-N-acetyl-D-mannosaminuronic acid dehydrogenase [Colwellia sp. MT41]
MSFETISVIGLGYIGLPTAAMFAAYGKNVIGVDVNKNTVDTINRGEIHIVEPDLDAIVHKAVTDGKLKAVLKPEPADAFLIAVPTPFLPIKNEGDIPQPDLKYIQAAAKSIAPVLKKGDLVILESTSPVGATEQMADWLAEYRSDLTFPKTHGEESDIRVAHCPERVLPGHVVRELVENDRVIGGLTTKCSEQSVELYKTFVQGDCVITNARTAEMAKLTENSCRDVQIAFANELSIICDELDINVWELISLANRHPRINILQPGPGVGGHCIAVDPWFIVAKTPKQAQLIHTARKVNDSKPQWVIDKVKIAIADFLQANPSKITKEVTIACYGLAFKPDIDDLRESPALNIAQQLASIHSGRTLGIEPNIHELPNHITNIELISFERAIEEADIHLMLVDHKEFKTNKVELANVIDTKGIWK